MACWRKFSSCAANSSGSNTEKCMLSQPWVRSTASSSPVGASSSAWCVARSSWACQSLWRFVAHKITISRLSENSVSKQRGPSGKETTRERMQRKERMHTSGSGGQWPETIWATRGRAGAHVLLGALQTLLHLRRHRCPLADAHAARTLCGRHAPAAASRGVVTVAFGAPGGREAGRGGTSWRACVVVVFRWPPGERRAATGRAGAAERLLTQGPRQLRRILRDLLHVRRRWW
jgi:hypothetical protein